jgi:glycosyltransferase involved in cell wall biosynthesis
MISAPVRGTPVVSTLAHGLDQENRLIIALMSASSAAVIFFCPPATVLNGGQRYLFRMAEALIAQGIEAVVFEEAGRRPSWFASTAPVVGQGTFAPNKDQILILPEDQRAIVELFASWPQRKIVYMQNHFYAAGGVAAPRSFADFGVTDILCSSRVIEAYARRRHPACKAHVIPCSVDPTLFAPRPKKKQIAFMPRKRPIEAAFVQDLFAALTPKAAAWSWMPIVDRTEAETAALLGESAVFLSLSRLEGFGLTPIEAMASGCIVAGFVGGGGRDYATPENGFWVPTDDPEAVLSEVLAAVELAEKPPAAAAARQAYDTAARATAARYTPALFQQAVQEIWGKVQKDEKTLL